MAAVMLVLASCSTQYQNHGYVPTDDQLAEVFVGKDTKDTVASVIGQPSAAGILDSSGWYYVQSRFRHFAYQQPKEIERQVVAISFDARGVVSNIERFGLENGKVIQLSRSVTESTVGGTSFLRQLLGNIGNPDAGALFGR